MVVDRGRFCLTDHGGKILKGRLFHALKTPEFFHECGGCRVTNTLDGIQFTNSLRLASPIAMMGDAESVSFIAIGEASLRLLVNWIPSRVLVTRHPPHS